MRVKWRSNPQMRKTWIQREVFGVKNGEREGGEERERNRKKKKLDKKGDDTDEEGG